MPYSPLFRTLTRRPPAAPRASLRPAAAALAALALLAHAAPLSAQALEPRTPVERTELGGRVHLQWNSTSRGEPSSEFLVRRARIWVASRVNDWIDGAIQVDMAAGKVSARYAFVRMALGSSTRLAFGQFKRAFDLFELTSSSRILVIERDGNIRGAGDCGGLGGVCSYSRFSEKLQFSSLDVGMLLDGSLAGGRVGYLASFTNGTGGNAREDNDAKSGSLRLTWKALPSLLLGVNAAVHDWTRPDGATDFAPAWAVDAEWGDFDGGLHVQTGVMAGDNWRLPDEGGRAHHFRAWQGIVTYRWPVAGHRVHAVEPVLRLSSGDPARDVTGDGGSLVTGGLLLHFDGRNKVAANVDAWRPRSGDATWGLKLQTYLYF